MGRPRFYYVRRAEDLAAAKTNLELWERKTMNEKKALFQAQITQTGNKRSDRGRKPGYIAPFGLDQALNVWLNVWLLVPSADDPKNEQTGSEETATSIITTLVAAVYGGTKKYAQIAIPEAAGEYLFDFKKQMRKVARVSISEFEGASKTLTSRITGMEYSYRKSNSVSCAFGQAIGTDTEMFGAMSAIEATLNDSGHTANFKPQGDLGVGVTSA